MSESQGGVPKGFGCAAMVILLLLLAIVPSGGARSLVCVLAIVVGIVMVVQWSKRQEQEKLRAARREPLEREPHVVQDAAVEHPPLGESYAVKARLRSADG